MCVFPCSAILPPICCSVISMFGSLGTCWKMSSRSLFGSRCVSPGSPIWIMHTGLPCQHTYIHTHTRWRPDYAQHCGGRKGTSRKILLPSKELSIVKSTNVFLNQLGAWWRSQCHGTQRNKIAFWTELARRSSVEEDTTGAF